MWAPWALAGRALVGPMALVGLGPGKWPTGYEPRPRSGLGAYRPRSGLGAYMIRYVYGSVPLMSDKEYDEMVHLAIS